MDVSSCGLSIEGGCLAGWAAAPRRAVGIFRSERGSCGCVFPITFHSILARAGVVNTYPCIYFHAVFTGFFVSAGFSRRSLQARASGDRRVRGRARRRAQGSFRPGAGRGGRFEHRALRYAQALTLPLHLLVQEALRPDGLLPAAWAPAAI